MNISELLAISVRGASHIKSGKPVQDYSLAIKGDGFSIAVVCDGHGSDRYFRSEIGSELAAKATQNKLIEFFEQNQTWELLSDNTDIKLSRLKLSILTAWQIAIEEYTKQNPFTEEELQKASPSLTTRMAYNVAHPYGTTALAALVSKEYYLVLMIGDGAIAKIKSDYSASIVTFPGKRVFEDQPHSVTDSLCELDAYMKMHCAYEKINDEILAFSLCTDGMSEAFQTDDYLLAKINNYLNYYAEEGLEEATSAISAQLNQLSKLSTQDDISIAFATLYLEEFDMSKQTTADNAAETQEEPAADESIVAEDARDTSSDMTVTAVDDGEVSEDKETREAKNGDANADTSDDQRSAVEDMNIEKSSEA